LAEAIINLIVSLILVNFIGLYGVLVGTIIALIYRTNDIIIYANKRILNRSPLKTYVISLTNFCLFLVCVYFESIWDLNIDSFYEFILYGVSFSFIMIVVYVSVASIMNPKGFLLLYNI